MEQTYVRSEKGYVVLNAVGGESVLVRLDDQGSQARASCSRAQAPLAPSSSRRYDGPPGRAGDPVLSASPVGVGANFVVAPACSDERGRTARERGAGMLARVGLRAPGAGGRCLAAACSGGGAVSSLGGAGRRGVEAASAAVAETAAAASPAAPSRRWRPPCGWPFAARSPNFEPGTRKAHLRARATPAGGAPSGGHAWSARRSSERRRGGGVPRDAPRQGTAEFLVTLGISADRLTAEAAPVGAPRPVGPTATTGATWTSIHE
jgi:hypothetical protein